jgi:hypothetical protein
MPGADGDRASAVVVVMQARREGGRPNTGGPPAWVGSLCDHDDDRHDVPVSADTFWRRVDPGAVHGLDPAELRKLVPYWFDDRFQQERSARIVVGAEDTGALISELLRLGAGDGPDAEAAWLAIDGAAGFGDDDMVGILAPEQVAKAAEFLSRAQPAAWMQQFGPELAAAAREMGYHRPFDEEWAQTVVADTEELMELFRLAAASGEAVIVSMVA